MTAGNEPRSAATPDGVEDRIAEEVVAELDLHAVGAGQPDEPYPSMSEQISEQLGGVRGLIESSIPVLAFVLFNVLLGDTWLDLPKRTALGWAIAGAVGTAVLIGVIRLARRQSVRHAVNGIIGIAVGAVLAWRTGDAKNFYLPGILLTLAQSAVLVLSVAVRRPIVGYVWGVLANGGRQNWSGNARLFRTFQWLTLVWAGSLFVRAGVQGWLWLRDEATAIGLVRIVISWPIYAVTFAFTVWAVRRVTRVERAHTA